MSKVQLVWGRDLSQAELAIINEARQHEFHSVSLVSPHPGNDDWDKPYFLVRTGAN